MGGRARLAAALSAAALVPALPADAGSSLPSVHLALPGAHYAASSAQTGRPATLWDAGDLDGDGSGDVLQVSYPSTSSQPEARVVARRGRDGKVLSSRRVTAPAGHDLFAAPLRGVGFVVADYVIGGGRDRLVLTGYDARARSRWTWQHSGTTSSDGTSGTSRQLAAGFDARGGTSILVTLVDETYDDVSYASGIHLVTLDAVTGRVTATVAQDAPNGLATGGSVPDQDGDGRPDLFVADGGSGLTRVCSGRTGAELWRTTSQSEYDAVLLQGAGALTGSRVRGRLVEDLVLTSGTPVQLSALGTTLPVPDPRTTRDGRAELLRGGSGTTLWSRPAVVADRGGSGVLLLDSAQELDGRHATLSLVDAMGTARWTGEAKQAYDSGAGPQMVSASDLTGDGAPDAAVVDTSTSEYLDGRSGAPLFSSNAFPLGVSLDGHGEELVDPQDDRFRVLDGATRRQLLVVPVPEGSGIVVDTLAVGGGRSDLLVALTHDGRATFSVRTASGATRWTASA